MRYQAMPDHGLKSLSKGRDPQFFHRRDDHNHVARLFRVAAVTTDDPVHFEAAPFGFLDRRDDVGTDVSLEISPAYGKDQDGILFVGMTDLEPFNENRLPAFVVRTRRKLSDIVGWCVGFNGA